MSRYASVAVDCPTDQEGLFTYLVPPQDEVVPGDLVIVPFGSAFRQGVVRDLNDQPPATLDIDVIKQIQTVIQPSPIIDPIRMELGEWVARHHYASLYSAYSLALPPTTGSMLKTKVWRPAEPADTDQLTATEKQLFDKAPSDKSKAMARSMLERKAGPNGARVVAGLIKKGVLEVEQSTLSFKVNQSKDPLAKYIVQGQLPVSLTAEQSAALETVNRSIRSTQPTKKPILLFGKTGTGKTEIYIKAAEQCLALGKGVLILVPELSLTPQMLQRFSTRFANDLALLHSGLTTAQRINQWAKIRDGERRLVLGVRSAIFAPLPKPGLIIIDEAHEWTYKEPDGGVLYDARVVAEKLAQISSATLILGSATPDLAHRRRAEIGSMELLELHQRPLKATKNGQRVRVSVVDMRQQARAGNLNPISPPLLEALEEVLLASGKAILFINRLGVASVIRCKQCGETKHCPRCDVNLALHTNRAGKDFYSCHYCGYTANARNVCANCKGREFDTLIAGIQTVERQLKTKFPTASIVRWDSETATNFEEHNKIVNDLVAGKTDIILGTQMVVKGLDIPDLNLAAILSADTILGLPDYRSDERAFQVITQLIGRTGRGVERGRAVIQTFEPDHYAMAAALGDNYELFYREALEIRARHFLPPFSSLVKLLFTDYRQEQARKQANSYADKLKQVIARQGFSDITVIGPSPMYPFRLRNRYRMQLILKGKQPERLLDKVPPRFAKVDADPLGFI